MTETGSHTPGPWEFDTGFIVAPDPAGVFPDIYIAEIAREDEEGRVAPCEQHEANGRLIAAAPELLAALKALHQLATMSDLAFAPANVLAGIIIDRAEACA